MTAGEGAPPRAEALGIPAHKVDGNDVVAVYLEAQRLVREIRAGGGPRLLHATTYRVKGHVSVDPAKYRDPKEVEAALRDDPLQRARAAFVAAGGDESDARRIAQAARDEIAAAVDAAEAAPWPPASAAFEEVQTAGGRRWY
jgi:pyruvate dehydrogenase E1 component alpha subunit